MERPILFSGPMVRAILHGRKKQTLRVINSQPTLDFHYRGWYMKDAYEWTTCHPLEVRYPKTQRHVVRCPYGVPGDRLWVRETFWYQPPSYKEVFGIKYQKGDEVLLFRADGEVKGGVKWKPAIFMPRWASRITLEITEVRVQRVQEISEEDAKAEGVYVGSLGAEAAKGYYGPRNAFKHLWDSINAKRGFGWDANPWVWTVTFRKVQ